MEIVNDSLIKSIEKLAEYLNNTLLESNVSEIQRSAIM